MTGGPGTGKTLVAAAIVRGFQRLGIAADRARCTDRQGGESAHRGDRAPQLATGGSDHGPAPVGADAAPPARLPRPRLRASRAQSAAGRRADRRRGVDDRSRARRRAARRPARLGTAGADRGRAPAPCCRCRPDPRRSRRSRRRRGRPRRGAAPQPSHGRGGSARPRRCSRPRRRSIAAMARRCSRRGRRSPRRERPGTLAFSGVEWVDTVRADGRGGAEVARQVAATAWHHFGGPRAQAVANDTVFRFVDGAIVPAQAAALADLWERIGRARILHRHARPADRRARAQRAPPRARARQHDGHRAAPTSCPASP